MTSGGKGGILGRVKRQCIDLLPESQEKFDVERIPVDLFAHALSWLGTLDTLVFLAQAKRKALFTHQPQEFEYWLGEQTVLTIDNDDTKLVLDDIEAESTGKESSSLLDYIRAIKNIVTTFKWLHSRSSMLPSRRTLNTVVHLMPRLRHVEIHFLDHDEFEIFMDVFCDEKASNPPLTKLILEWWPFQGPSNQLSLSFPGLLISRYAAIMEVLKIDVPQGGTRLWRQLIDENTPKWPNLHCLSLRCNWQPNDLVVFSAKAPNLQTYELRSERTINIEAMPVPEHMLISVEGLKQMLVNCPNIILFSLYLAEASVYHVELTRKISGKGSWGFYIRSMLDQADDVSQHTVDYIQNMIVDTGLLSYDRLALELDISTRVRFEAFLQSMKTRDVKVQHMDIELCDDKEEGWTDIQRLQAIERFYPDLNTLEIDGAFRLEDRKLILPAINDAKGNRQLLQHFVETKRPLDTFGVPHIDTSVLKLIFEGFAHVRHVYDSIGPDDLGAPGVVSGDRLLGSWLKKIDQIKDLQTLILNTMTITKADTGLEFWILLAKKCPNLRNLCLHDFNDVMERDILAFHGLERLRIRCWTEHIGASYTPGAIQNSTLHTICQQNPGLRFLSLEISEVNIRPTGQYPVSGEFLQTVAFTTIASSISVQEIQDIQSRCPRLRHLILFLGKTEATRQWLTHTKEAHHRSLTPDEQLKFLRHVSKTGLSITLNGPPANKRDQRHPDLARISLNFYDPTTEMHITDKVWDFIGYADAPVSRYVQGKDSKLIPSQASQGDTKTANQHHHHMLSLLQATIPKASPTDIHELSVALQRAGDLYIQDELRTAPQREVENVHITQDANRLLLSSFEASLQKEIF